VASIDGGVWLRAGDAPTFGLGVTGVLLIFLNDALHPNALFWHEVTNPETYGPELNSAFNLPLGNFSLQIDVQGNRYSANSTAATTFISNRFTSGFAGLYDEHDVSSTQSFDNFRLSDAPAPVPIPPVGGLFGLILASMGLLGWWRRRIAHA
jgi:hypothetical protein